MKSSRMSQEGDFNLIPPEGWFDDIDDDASQVVEFNEKELPDRYGVETSVELVSHADTSPLDEAIKDLRQQFKIE